MHQLLCLFLLFSIRGLAQQDALHYGSVKDVRFEVRIGKDATTEKDQATILLQRYVVHISDDRIRSLRGKRIQISGKAILERGIHPDDSELRQGRVGDNWHIYHPRIIILKP